jgi:hypothetical protein
MQSTNVHGMEEMNKNFKIEFEDDDLLPMRGDEGEDAGREGGGGGKGGE